jgi:hypothetical protein
MDDSIKRGDLVNLNSHIDARNRAAYAIYALERHHIWVDTYGRDYLVKGKPGLDDSRNALLRSLFMKPIPPATIFDDPAPYGAGDKRFSYTPPDRAPLTPEQRAVAMANSVRNDRPQVPITVKDTSLFEAYARHLKKVVGLEASGVNVDGDMILVDPKSVAEFIGLPCKAGYAVHEQTLVVKIAGRDLLDRYCVGSGGDGDGSTSPVADGSVPITDWLGAALGDPSQSRGMCSQFGYTQEPEFRRRGVVGPRRRR